MTRHAFSRALTARRTLVALAAAGIALGAGAATASAADVASLRPSPHAVAPADDESGTDVSGLTGPVTQTGKVGAVPALQRVAEGLFNDPDD